MEETEKEEVWNEGKDFLGEIKEIIAQALKVNKKVEYKSENLLILSIKDELHGIFEVYDFSDDDFPAPKLIYIGDKGLRKSYLLNLINKEESRVLLKEKYTQ